MKKWLAVETILLTLLPTVLLIYALPVLFLSIVLAIFPAGEDTRTLSEIVLGMLPYVGGILGLVTIWRYALDLSRGVKFQLDYWFATAIIGGGLATWELILTTNMTTSLLVCLPVWFLVAHLLFLRSSEL